MNTKSYLFLFTLLSTIVMGCKKEEKGSPGPNEIWLEYKAYNPSQMVVTPGTTVTFVNKDNASHTVTSTSNIFDSGTVKSGNTWTYTFNDLGTFYFYCNYHSTNSAEQGAILVKQ
ncbi:MAG: cupredoxin domain-containing protein [Bacteroidia bacterium]